MVRKSTPVAIPDDAVLLHFCPPATALKLERLERDYAADQGRTDLRVVAKTRFVVKKTESGYDLEVKNQRYFARYEGEVKP